jgi:hypothetical protein
LVDTDRPGVVGLSSGAGTTPDRQVERRSRHLDLERAPPTDLPAITEFWKESRQSFPAVVDLNPADQKDYSPIQHVSPDDPPALIVHGDQDKTVPYQLEMVEWFEKYLQKK